MRLLLRRAPAGNPPGWSGVRRYYTVAVFIVLASLDNVAIGLVPPLYSPISQSMGVSESAVSLATAASYLVSAFAAVSITSRDTVPTSTPNDTSPGDTAVMADDHR